MTMKETLFTKLEKIKNEISVLSESDKAKAKTFLMSANEITDQFNKGKVKKGSELDLNDNDLTKLKNAISEIWEAAATKNLEVWPKPDFTEKIG